VILTATIQEKKETNLNDIPVGMSQVFPFTLKRNTVYIIQGFLAVRADPGNSKTRALGNASRKI